MSVERLELSTNGLKGRCSTIELHARGVEFYHVPGGTSTDFSGNIEADWLPTGSNRGEQGFVGKGDCQGIQSTRFPLNKPAQNW